MLVLAHVSQSEQNGLNMLHCKLDLGEKVANNAESKSSAVSDEVDQPYRNLVHMGHKIKVSKLRTMMRDGKVKNSEQGKLWCWKCVCL